MKKFTRIVESLIDVLNTSEEYLDIQEELMDMVDNTISSDDTDLKVETIKSFIEDNNTTIIGLVNDSDVFDFYMKHRTVIDRVLSDTDHFSKSPETVGTFDSVYEYIIVSTKVGVQELFKQMVVSDDQQ